MTTIKKLIDRRITTSDSVIIVDSDPFKMFHETTLKIAGMTSFDSGIDETFMTSHTVKVEFLRLQPHQKMTGNESASNSRCFEGFEVPLAITGTQRPSSSCCLRAEEI